MRPIDADALKAELSADCPDDEMAKAIVEIFKACIDNAPTIEPERKRGKWIIDHLCSTSGGTYQVLRCSLCESSEPWLMGRNFCPNCGTDMRGDNK